MLVLVILLLVAKVLTVVLCLEAIPDNVSPDLTV